MGLDILFLTSLRNQALSLPWQPNTYGNNGNPVGLDILFLTPLRNQDLSLPWQTGNHGNDGNLVALETLVLTSLRNQGVTNHGNHLNAISITYLE